ncbi:MAG: carboxylating nicotinate-nucleotide diphosphorylase [Armatimonadota bacterium]
MFFQQVDEIIRRALAEDVGTGDITTELTIPPGHASTGRIIAREAGVLSGVLVAERVFALVARYLPIAVMAEPAGEGETYRITMKREALEAETNLTHPGRPVARVAEEVDFTAKLTDGGRIVPGAVVAEIEGPTAAILTAERTALNLLQRMSGIATGTARMVELVRHTGARIVDTRKTTPGLRVLEKYAVTCGGGRNHRFGLYDAVLIKDNHIRAAGGVSEAVKAARVGHTVKVEVEADTLLQVEEALIAGADMILLDNMSPEELRKAVSLCRGRAVTEASGGITEETIVAVAEAGVELISVGALTHSVKALDLSLEID